MLLPRENYILFIVIYVSESVVKAQHKAKCIY